MALKNIRININESIKLDDAFMSHDLGGCFIRGSFESIVLDGMQVEFTQSYSDKETAVDEKVSDGTWHHQVRLRATAKGYYGEEVKFVVTYSKFTDRIYKRNRPERATIKLTVENESELKYPLHEVYAILSGEFSDN